MNLLLKESAVFQGKDEKTSPNDNSEFLQFLSTCESIYAFLNSDQEFDFEISIDAVEKAVFKMLSVIHERFCVNESNGSFHQSIFVDELIKAASKESENVICHTTCRILTYLFKVYARFGRPIFFPYLGEVWLIIMPDIKPILHVSLDIDKYALF